MDAILQALTDFSNNVITFFDELGTLFSNVISFVISFFKELAAFCSWLWSSLDYVTSFWGDLLPVELASFLVVGLILVFILRLLGRY